MLEETYRIARSGLLAHGLWTSWLVREEKGELRFDGWAIPPRDLPMKLRFFVNGVECRLLKQPPDPALEDVVQRYGLHGDSTRYAFRGVVPRDLLGSAKNLRVEFRPGSGRELAPGKFTGTDIDPDNIQWCKEKVPQAEFAAIGLHPPTGFAGESFDLVYGISVFTHLSETDQDRWLAELQRITKPGAAVLMSIQGEIAFLRVDGDFQRFLALERTGLHIYGRCPDLDDVLPEVKESEYYKNVFHSRRYIYEHWARYFEIVEVIDAAFAGYRDLVVMRRR